MLAYNVKQKEEEEQKEEMIKQALEQIFEFHLDSDDFDSELKDCKLTLQHGIFTFDMSTAFFFKELRKYLKD